MSRFVRASKFRHVFGTAEKREKCIDNVKPSRNAWDSNLIKANPLYIGVCWEAAGGGAFLVQKQSEVGKLPAQPPLFSGHKAAVLDIDFHPFNDYVVASCAEDCKIMIWSIPENLSAPQTTPVSTLPGHQRKVGYVQFHPTADNTLASAGFDLSVKLWDIEKGVEKCELIGNPDMIQSLTFNSTGNLLATPSKDKKIRVFDIRAGKVIAEAASHEGTKNQRSVWLGDSNRIATTGFSKTSERQLFVRDIGNFGETLVSENIDSSAGVLMPFYDEDCKMLYLAGKGDGNIRYYEMVDEKPWQFLLSEYKSNEPQRGVAFVPKRAVNVTQIEVARAYKLQTSLVEPISFQVPRKSDAFQDDIYPPALSGEASLSADEFWSGKTAAPKRISLEKGFTPGVRKDLNYSAARIEDDKSTEPKNDKEFREAYYKLKKENEDLMNKLALKDVQIRQLELANQK